MSNIPMRQSGFTLLEILVVLTIVGLITAISTPKLNVMYERFEFGLEKDDLISQLKVLGYKAYNRGEGFTLAQAFEQPNLIQVADGWGLGAGKEIYYSAIGVCDGGKVELIKGVYVLPLEFTPPLCVPHLAN